MSLLIPIKRDYNNSYALKNLVLYGLDINKTKSHKVLLEGEFIGFGVNPYNAETIIESFNLTKRRYDKSDGKQVYHFVLSVYQQYDFGAEHRLDIAKTLIFDVGNYLLDKGFQNVGFIHNYFGNVHIHFVVNSVNAFTKLKLHNENSFYFELLGFLRENWNNLGFSISYNVDDLYGYYE